MKTEHPGQDADLRRALRESLRSPDPRVPAADSEALQARVIAQWRQRHPQQLVQTEPLIVGWHGKGAGRPRAWWLVGMGVLVAALAMAWGLRPDPVLDELLQPDVLSQIGLGEL